MPVAFSTVQTFHIRILATLFYIIRKQNSMRAPFEIVILYGFSEDTHLDLEYSAPSLSHLDDRSGYLEHVTKAYTSRAFCYETTNLCRAITSVLYAKQRLSLELRLGLRRDTFANQVALDICRPTSNRFTVGSIRIKSTKSGTRSEMVLATPCLKISRISGIAQKCS